MQICLLCCLGALAPTSSFAYDLPPVNLGFTSFLDGAPPAGPRLYFAQYLPYWTSDSFRDHDGHRLFPKAVDEDLSVWISLTQFIYQSNRALLLGGKWGLDVILPYVDADLGYNIDAPLPQANSAGFEDLLIGPYLQRNPIMGPAGPRFMHRKDTHFFLILYLETAAENRPEGERLNFRFVHHF